MELTIYTLMMAVKAMQRDIARHEVLAADETLGEEELEYYGQMVMDQMPAFGELRVAYEKAQADNPEFPVLDQLLYPEKYKK